MIETYLTLASCFPDRSKLTTRFTSSFLEREKEKEIERDRRDRDRDRER